MPANTTGPDTAARLALSARLKLAAVCRDEDLAETIRAIAEGQVSHPDGVPARVLAQCVPAVPADRLAACVKQARRLGLAAHIGIGVRLTDAGPPGGPVAVTRPLNTNPTHLNPA